MKLRQGVAGVLLMCGVSGCGPGLGLTPTEPESCRDVAGAYVSSYGNSCGRFSIGDAATVTQTGCRIEVTVNGVGVLKGAIVKDTVDWAVDFGGDCTGTGTGTGRLDGTQITGTYAGLVTGTSCCAPSMAGTFSLSRK